LAEIFWGCHSPITYLVALNTEGVFLVAECRKDPLVVPRQYTQIMKIKAKLHTAEMKLRTYIKKKKKW